MALSKTLSFNVKCKEPELVVPERPTPHEIKPLSDIDDQEGLRFLVPFLFFYPSSEKGKILEDPVKNVRDGLAKALVVYYPLAGRILEGPNKKLMVDCNNKGVQFVEADANVKLEQLMPPCPYMDKLVCKVPDSGGIIGSPILFFQVTRFTCGGFSLGIWVSHTIADGSGIMLFLDAISELLKGASTPSTPPVWQRDLLSARFPPRITCTHYEFKQLPSENKNQEDNMVLASVYFGPREIQALRNQVPTNQTPSSPTRFELITACLWKCRTIALEPNPRDITRVSIVMNIRQRKEIGLPSGYYGNGFVYPAAVSRARILCESPLAYAVNLVQGAKAKLSEEYVKSVADFMVIKGRPKYATNLNYIVSDLTRLGFDKLDLGWGKPLYAGIPWAASVISFYTNLKNDKGEDGVLVPICLPSLVLEKFLNELDKVTWEPILE